MRGYSHLDLAAGVLLLAGLAALFLAPDIGWGLILIGAGVFKYSLRRDFLARLGTGKRRD